MIDQWTWGYQCEALHLLTQPQSSLTCSSSSSWPHDFWDIVVTWSCTIRKYFPWIPNQLSVPLRFIQLQCQVLPRLGPHVVKNTAWPCWFCLKIRHPKSWWRIICTLKLPCSGSPQVHTDPNIIVLLKTPQQRPEQSGKCKVAKWKAKICRGLGKKNARNYLKKTNEYKYVEKNM